MATISRTIWVWPLAAAIWAPPGGAFCGSARAQQINSGIPTGAGSTAPVAAPVQPAFDVVAPGNIFTGTSAEVTLTLPTAFQTGQGKVTLRNERDDVVRELPVPGGQSAVKIPLPTKGFYRIQAQLQDASGKALTVETCAAVLGPAAPAELRRTSPLGLMAVGGKREAVSAGGAGWDRGFIPQLGIGKNPDGTFRWHAGYSGKEPSQGEFQWVSALMAPPPFVVAKEHHGQNFYSKVYPPADWDTYRRVVRFFANATPWVRYFEGINEPDAGHWQGTDEDLVKYHRVLREEIHAAGHGQKLLGPCFWHVDLVHLDKLVKLGLLDAVDGISIHSYAEAPPEGKWIEDIRKLRQYLAAQGKPDFPVYLTEFGWATGNGDFPSPQQELAQANMASRGMALLAAENLQAAVYFCMRYEGGPEATQWSIVRKDGTPRAAYAALGTTFRWLVGASGGQVLRPTPGGYMVLFRHGSNTRAVAWDTGNGGRLRLPARALRLESMTGAPIKPEADGSLKLQESPVYMEFAGTDLAELRTLPGQAVTSEAKSLVRGNDLTLPRADNWVLPAPLEMRGNNLFAPRTTPPGSYLAIATRNGKWSAQEVRVLPSWQITKHSLIWNKGAAAPALELTITSSEEGAKVRPCVRLLSGADVFGPQLTLSASKPTAATIPLAGYIPGTPLRGALVLEGRSGANLETLELPLDTLPIPAAPVTPGADGAIAWDGAPIIGSRHFVPYGILAGESITPEDCSLKFQVAHDGSNLYLKVQVQDDGWVRATETGALWNADSLQFAFNLDAGRGGAISDARVVEFTAGRQGTKDKVLRTASYVAALPTNAEVPGASLRLNRNGTVTTYEITLPWAAMGFNTPGNAGAIPAELGFDLAVNDVDPGRKRRALELTPGIVASKNPAGFATLLLQR